MAAVITFFPVGNGDMTLLQLENERTILIDVNIRQPGDGVRDVAADLRSRLKVDGNGRPYVDAMVLSHPDQDHCRGLIEHFHLGLLSDYKKPSGDDPAKIVIREMWSSPMVFRRASKSHTLCPDAKAWKKEAVRRVEAFRKNSQTTSGDRIQILGEDQDGQTDDLTAILVKAGGAITSLDGVADGTFRGRLLAPKGKGTAEEEERRSKNHSSVIIRFSVAHGGKLHACKFLSAGDAEVAIWERIWADHNADTSTLDYHMMQTPHHCSWHSLSYDSWSEWKEKAKVSSDARKALGQAKAGAYIIGSSNQILDDGNDPPCIRAKREYEAILAPGKGVFLSTGVYGDTENPVPMEFDISASGPTLRALKTTASATAQKSLLRAPVAASLPAGVGFPPRPVTPTKPAGFA